jgi:hypothetical protein
MVVPLGIEAYTYNDKESSNDENLLVAVLESIALERMVPEFQPDYTQPSAELMKK